MATDWTCDLRERQHKSFELTNSRNGIKLKLKYSLFGKKTINYILNMVSLKLYGEFYGGGASSSRQQKLGRAVKHELRYLKSHGQSRQLTVWRQSLVERTKKRKGKSLTQNLRI